MTFAEFRNALCILKSIDRHELEAVGIIDVPKGQDVFPGCLDKPDAIWRLFRDDPYYWLLWINPDDRSKGVKSTQQAEGESLLQGVR